MNQLAREYYADDAPRTVLEADCAIRPELLTIGNIDSLNQLEPCGNGCPKPVLVMEDLQIERLGQVGNGKHMRLRLRSGHYSIPAIYFSATPQSASVAQGDLVDVAFVPQVNEFRGERSVQMNVLDIRPHCDAACQWQTGPYRDLRKGELTPETASQLLPERSMLATVWRYLASSPVVQENPMCLCRKIVRWSGSPMDLGQLLTCLDIFADVGLLQITRHHKYMELRVVQRQEKADLNASATMQRLNECLAAKEK